MPTRSAPILECSPQAAGDLGDIGLTSSDSGSRRTLVFRIQIATNEARNALPSFWGQWTGTSEFDQLLLNAGNVLPEDAGSQMDMPKSRTENFERFLRSDAVVGILRGHGRA